MELPWDRQPWHVRGALPEGRKEAWGVERSQGHPPARSRRGMGEGGLKDDKRDKWMNLKPAPSLLSAIGERN